jgi:hypothetical protein
MADNVSTVADANATLPASTAIATDDVGGVHYQRIKLDVGADGAASPVGAAGLPVNDAGGSLTVDGTVGVSGSVAVTGTFFQATQPVSVASAVPVTDNGGSLTVDGTFWQATQPVSGTVTANAGTNLNTSLLATEAELEATTAATLAVGTAVAAVETAIEDLGADADAADIVYLAKLDDIIAATEATQAAVQTIDNAIAGSEMQVDIVSGSVTANAGTNLNTSALALEAGGNLDDIVTLLTAQALLLDGLETELAAIKTAVQLIDNSISGSETQVDVVAALPAGTNNIGDVDIASTPKVTSATLENVASSATNVTLFDSNAAAKGRMIHNDSTAVLYVKFGATATSSSYTVKMASDSYYEFPEPVYTGIVDGIWASANGSARCTET